MWQNNNPSHNAVLFNTTVTLNCDLFSWMQVPCSSILLYLLKITSKIKILIQYTFLLSAAKLNLFTRNTHQSLSSLPFFATTAMDRSAVVRHFRQEY